MAKRRHQARKMALQVLYGLNYLPEASLPDIIDRLSETEQVSRKNWTPFARESAQGVREEMESLDRNIESALQNWRLERLSRVDLIILRLALFEMRHCQDIPIRVSLNEYVEIAKEFGTDESFAFVNGILDRLAKDFPEKDFQKKDFQKKGGSA